MRPYRRFLCLALLPAPVLVAASLLSAPARAVPPRPAPDPVGSPPSAIVWEGVGSCSSSGCHGALRGSAEDRRCAVTTWTRDDPHANSWFALRSARSKQILARMNRLASVAEAKPETEAVCLKCHAMNVPAELQGPKFDATEGVGCESCHGPAGVWKPMHDLPAWQGLSAAEKAGFGMRPLRNAAVRADVCAGCHQGSPNNDVNHDLIAAGHPALFFDVSAQTDRMPYHWDRSIDRQQPDFSARLWLSGQMIGARMSMELLEARAKEEKRWPEFSEYSCLACHRTTQLDQLPQAPGQHLGNAPYMAWNQMTTRLLARGGRFEDAELAKLFDELSAEMNKPLPDRKVVGDRAAAIRGRLDGMIGRLEATKLDKDDLRTLMKVIASENAAKPEARWFTGVQVTSALTALDRAVTDLDPSARRPDVDAALRKLQQSYPPPVDSGWLRQPGPKSMAPFLTPLLDALR